MPKKLLWSSDLHLNFYKPHDIDVYIRDVQQHNPDYLVFSGDISNAPHLIGHLRYLAVALPQPIYFVLGNHDYYHSSMAKIHALMQTVSSISPNLHWLRNQGVVELTPKTGMVGHGAYADARFGDYPNSTMSLNDYVLIHEFAGLDHSARGQKLNVLGDEAAAYFDRYLPDALSRYEHLIVVTHPPPFREAALHRGKISDDNSLPHFSCKAVGEALLRNCAQRSNCDVTVLCGHTHGGGDVQVRENLRVIASAADYQLRVEDVFSLQ